MESCGFESSLKIVRPFFSYAPGHRCNVCKARVFRKRQRLRGFFREPIERRPIAIE
jgi:hypothetical protein